MGHGCTEDHGTEDLSGDGLEEVRSLACTVSDVVADEVGDDCGVPLVIFGDAGLYLAFGVRLLRGWNGGKRVPMRSAPTSAAFV